MKIHFVGIGGIGLSAIAQFLKIDGHEISGSDMRSSKITAMLKGLGMRINIPHDASAITDHDLLIYSAAVKDDNVELVEAKRRGIKTLSRKEALELVLSDKKVYSVCGAHGKSTTTAILAAILDGSALIGAQSKQLDSNCRAVMGELMVFEADESDGSFLFSHPHCAIVTNAEPEHMEYYNYDYELFFDGYKRFLQMAPLRVFNAEDPFLATLNDIEAVRLFPASDIANIRYEIFEGEPTTVFALRDLGEFRVWGFGEHIALDASLAILAALFELPLERIRQNIGRYRGNKKRFDLLVKTEDFVLIDDYAHHPTEIEATLHSAKEYAKLANLSTITAVWQPHKWSRTVDNLEKFCECFEGVDRLIILPVWAVNEQALELDFEKLFARYGAVLADRVKRDGDAVLLIKDDSVVDRIASGLFIGFGAGDITYQLRGER